MKGSSNGNARLGEREVNQIRALLALGFTQRAVAAHFRVVQSTVSDIAAGRTWGHLPPAHEGPLERISLEEAVASVREWGGVLGGFGQGVKRLRPGGGVAQQAHGGH